MQAWIQRKGIEAYIGEQITARMSVERAIMNAVSQWWIGGLRTRKAKVAGSIPTGRLHKFNGRGRDSTIYANRNTTISINNNNLISFWY